MGVYIYRTSHIVSIREFIELFSFLPHHTLYWPPSFGPSDQRVCTRRIGRGETGAKTTNLKPTYETDIDLGKSYSSSPIKELPEVDKTEGKRMRTRRR